MLPIPAKLKLWLGVILIGVVAALQQLIKVDPQIASVGNAILGLIMWIEGMLTVPSGAAKDLADANSNVAKLTAKLGGGALMLLALGGLFSGGLTACKDVKFPQLDEVEQVVLADVIAGKGAPQIEADVAQLVAGKTGADVIALVNDALGLLVDAGLIPAQYIPRAQELRRVERVRLGAEM